MTKFHTCVLGVMVLGTQLDGTISISMGAVLLNGVHFYVWLI